MREVVLGDPEEVVVMIEPNDNCREGALDLRAGSDPSK